MSMGVCATWAEFSRSSWHQNSQLSPHNVRRTWSGNEEWRVCADKCKRWYECQLGSHSNFSSRVNLQEEVGKGVVVGQIILRRC